MANIPAEGHAPTAPNIPDAQLRDEDIAPILIAKSQSNDKPKLEEILGALEKVKKLWSEWDRLEVIDGALYRRRKPSGRWSNPQLIVPESLTEQFIEAAHTGTPWAPEDHGSCSESWILVQLALERGPLLSEVSAMRRISQRTAAPESTGCLHVVRASGRVVMVSHERCLNVFFRPFRHVRSRCF